MIHAVRACLDTEAQSRPLHCPQAHPEGAQACSEEALAQLRARLRAARARYHQVALQLRADFLPGGQTRADVELLRWGAWGAMCGCVVCGVCVCEGGRLKGREGGEGIRA